VKKGIFAALTTALAALAVSVAPASAQGDNLTLNVAPNPALVGSSVTFSGRLTDSEGSGISDDIEIVEFTDPSCTEANGAEGVTTDENGDYTLGPLTTEGAPPGHYYFQAFYDEEAASACIDLLLVTSLGTSVAPQVSDIYLCYSAYETVPGVWSADQAVDLAKQGYWEPTAVDGNVPGGTNVGKYHLECNVPPKGDGYVGDNGTWYGPDIGSIAQQELGFYPH